MPATVYEFRSFRLDPPERLLLRGDQPVPLTPKAFDLLLYLVEHAGRLVGKQELMDALWPSTSVEETNLTFTISVLRKALGDGQNGEQFIQTVLQSTNYWLTVHQYPNHHLPEDACRR